VRVAEGNTSTVRQDQVATAASEQLLAQDLLEPMDLPADRRVCQAELGAGSRDASMLRDHPEVEQVMVIEPFHPDRSMSSFSNRDRDSVVISPALSPSQRG